MSRDYAHSGTMAMKVTKRAGWWVGMTVALVGLRWLAASSTTPYRAVLPDSWFEGTDFGLFRLASNAILSCVLLLVVPLAVARWTKHSTSELWLGAPKGAPWRWVGLGGGGVGRGRVDERSAGRGSQRVPSMARCGPGTVALASILHACLASDPLD